MMTSDSPALATAPALPARHPLRRRFPPPVVAMPSEENDLKLFALSFTAFFIVIYSFIA